ncbi:MAG: hypothetical protein KAW93_08660, partial [Methanogenium sp.]|nr:hypothetical protein [Methanogenium sp.]
AGDEEFVDARSSQIADLGIFHDISLEYTITENSLFAHTDRTRLTDGIYCIMEDLATVNISEQNNSVVV